MADVQRQWLPSPKQQLHWPLLADHVIQPDDPGTSGYIYCYRLLNPLRTGGAGHDIYWMEDPTYAGSFFVLAVKLWAYWHRPSSGGSIKGNVKMAGAWQQEKAFPDVGPCQTGWTSVTFNAPPQGWNLVDADLMEIDIGNTLPPVGYMHVYSLYAEVIFAERSTIRPNGGEAYGPRYPSWMEIWQVLSDEDNDTSCSSGAGGELEMQDAGGGAMGHTHRIEIWGHGSVGDLGSVRVWTNLDGATEEQYLPLEDGVNECCVSYSGYWTLSEIDDMTVGFQLSNDASLSELWVEIYPEDL
jgi:hypothetical protein